MHLSPWLPPLLLALATLAPSAEAATFTSKAVKQFTGNSFKAAVKASSKASLVVFYAPWCGHCKNLGPEFDKAADNLKGLANLVAIDCDADANKPYCGEMGIQGFPTLKFFPGGSAPAEDYQGERKAAPIVSFITSRMPTFAKPVTSSSALSALLKEPSSSSQKPLVVLFTASSKVTPLYKGLSAEFRKSIEFHVARDEKVGKEAMHEWGVEKVPTLVTRGVDGTIEKYTGALKYDDIKAFLTGFKDRGAKPKDEL